MKVISYDPSEISDMPAFLNEGLKTYNTDKYVMFVFNDILNAAKDKQVLCRAYEELLVRMNIPYAFFPYYVHFNRILPDTVRKPSPRISVNLKKSFRFDIVQEPAYGLMILDAAALRSTNFKFNEQYKLVFYIQDLIAHCFEKKLYFSNSFFLDVYQSYNLFKSDFKDGYAFNVEDFGKEKQLFLKDHQLKQEQINDFMKNLKNIYETKNNGAVTN